MMLEGCTKKRRKMVVNIGSAAAELGTPYIAVYAASKGYMLV
jgi:short-subunit dehydrogenase